MFCIAEDNDKKKMGFWKPFKDSCINLLKEGAKPLPIQFIRTAYCWQVAPLQSLLPLGPYMTNLKTDEE